MILRRSFASAALVSFILGCVGNGVAQGDEPAPPGAVSIQWAARIPLRTSYNSGKAVSDESMADARAVTVTLLHDSAHPSTLYVPLGQQH